MPASIMKTIEQKRMQMVYYGNKYGLSSEKTVQTSQELDLLLNKLANHKSAKKEKR